MRGVVGASRRAPAQEARRRSPQRRAAAQHAGRDRQHPPGMDTDGWALPESLRGSTFTTAEAKALRVGKRRLRSPRARRLHHGLWADAALELTFAHRCRIALEAVGNDGWISHASGAQLLQLTLPPRLRELDRIDVTVPAPARAPRGKGIRGRQRLAESVTTSPLDGMQVVTAAQAFVDGCDYLDFEDLVALGDSIVRERAPRATPESVVAAVQAHAGKRLHRQLVRAAHAIHPRAHSRPETITRLELRRAGVPEPWCNVPVLIDDGDAVAPDVAFWPAGMVLEVEGDQHRVDRAQWLVDLDRYNRFQRRDIEVHRLTVTTPAALRPQLAPIVERIWQRWDPTRTVPKVAPFFRGTPILGSAPWLSLDR